MERGSVEILMAAYNGEKYVAQQIESILSQSYGNFNLLISDDFSTDSTFDILLDYERKHPDVICVTRAERRFGNARDHFFSLMKKSTADYLFFCDQDDVWFPSKVELFMDKMKGGENEFGKECSLVVFSDQIPTDSALNPICDSLMEYQKQNPGFASFHPLVFQNVVTGGAMAFNRAASDKALRCVDSTKACMHDYWVAEVAACFGKCLYVDQATSYYRQHSTNEVGASNVRSLKYIAHKLSHLGNVQKKMRQDKLQAATFADTYSSELSKADLDFLRRYGRNRSGFCYYFRNRKYINGFFRFWGRVILG